MCYLYPYKIVTHVQVLAYTLPNCKVSASYRPSCINVRLIESSLSLYNSFCQSNYLTMRKASNYARAYLIAQFRDPHV